MCRNIRIKIISVMGNMYTTLKRERKTDRQTDRQTGRQTEREKGVSIRKHPATEVTTKTKNSKDCTNTSPCYSFRSVSQLTSNTEPVVN